MWVTLLGLGAGFCLYAGLQHVQFGRQSHDNNKHYIFSALAITAAVFFATSSVFHQLQNSAWMVTLSRVQFGAGILFIGILPWFVLTYCHQSGRSIPMLISAYMAVVLFANLTLPFALTYSSTPSIHTMTLPWGEVVTDVRAFKPSVWWHIWWLGMFLCFTYAVTLSVLCYRKSHRRESLFLLAGIMSFFLCVLVQFAISEGLIAFTNMGELGFLFLIFLMNYSLVDELKSANNRLKTVLECMPIAVYLKDAKGRYLVANKECEQFLGHPLDAIIGNTDSGLLPEARLQYRQRYESQGLTARMLPQFEEPVESGDGNRYYAVLKIPLFDPEGQLYGVCGVARDLTPQREAERQIREVKQQLWHVDRVARTGMMASTLIHELAQPLAAVKNNAQAGKKLLGAGADQQIKITQIFDDILRDVERAATVTSGMRTFLQKKNLTDGKVKVADVIREITDIFKVELQGRGVNLQLHCPTDSDQYWAAMEKSKLQQIFLNILMNAVDAMDGLAKNEKRLKVSMLNIGDATLQIVVSDTGSGIPPEYRDKVFEPFWTSKREGMGLGLAICKSIIDENNGEIRIVPNQRRGVSVIVSLPMSSVA